MSVQDIWVRVVRHEQEGSRSNPFRPSSFSRRSHVQHMSAVKYLLHTFHYFAVPLPVACRKHPAAQEPFGWFVQHSSLRIVSRLERELRKGDNARTGNHAANPRSHWRKILRLLEPIQAGRFNQGLELFPWASASTQRLARGWFRTRVLPARGVWVCAACAPSLSAFQDS